MSVFAKMAEKGIRKWVFLGGAGNGKSELAINAALDLRQHTQRAIHLLDMDQTKPLFRVRNTKDILDVNKINLHYRSQILDAPVVLEGVESLLTDADSLVVLDVGGDMLGAAHLGQFSAFLSTNDTCVLLPVNYYRNAHTGYQTLVSTLSWVLAKAGLKEGVVVSNPHLGLDTTQADVLEGHALLQNMLKDSDYKIRMLSVMEHLYDDKMEALAPEVFCIKTFIKTQV